LESLLTVVGLEVTTEGIRTGTEIEGESGREFHILGAATLKGSEHPHSSWATATIPTTRRTTLGDRAFSVTAARAWNALPSSVRSAPSLLQFRRDLKTALFQSSYSSP